MAINSSKHRPNRSRFRASTFVCGCIVVNSCSRNANGFSEFRNYVLVKKVQTCGNFFGPSTRRFTSSDDVSSYDRRQQHAVHNGVAKDSNKKRNGYQIIIQEESDMDFVPLPVLEQLEAFNTTELRRVLVDKSHLREDLNIDKFTSVDTKDYLGSGVRRDFQRRFKKDIFMSDFKDGLNSQSFAAALFLFFACLAPAIGFGGILSVATEGSIGVIEMISSTALCGIVYSLAAPQPLQILGPVGPVNSFMISLLVLAKMWAVPFLPLYAWTGLWTSGFLCVASLTNAANIVKHLTKFTDETFSVFLSTIFLIESFTSIYKPFASTSGAAPSTAFLTLLCAATTFGSGLFLKGLNKSIVLTKTIRNNLSNFAPAIGVVIGSVMAKGAAVRFGTASCALPALSLPTKFATTTGRPWLVPLFDLPIWARWACSIPALLATMLLFLDQKITARLVNNPQYKMEKGREKGNVIDGMHGDLMVVSALTALTSILGLPWMIGATTRSAAHVRSLLRTDEKTGEVVGTLENRVSGILIHALIGACVICSGPRNLLKQVPLPALSGVLMYLGFTSLQGLELWDRIRGLFHDPSVAPKERRWSSLPRATITVYTLVQMVCVTALMKISKSKFGVAAPLIIGLLPLIRLTLMKTGMVNKKSMDVLDP